MAINQLSTANTFQEWLTATSALVAVANNLTDHQPDKYLRQIQYWILQQMVL